MYRLRMSAVLGVSQCSIVAAGLGKKIDSLTCPALATVGLLKYYSSIFIVLICFEVQLHAQSVSRE